MPKAEAERWAQGVNKRITWHDTPTLYNTNRRLSAMLHTIKDCKAELCALETLCPSIGYDLGIAYEKLCQVEKHVLGATCNTTLDALGIKRIAKENYVNSRSQDFRDRV